MPFFVEIYMSTIPQAEFIDTGERIGLFYRNLLT